MAEGELAMQVQVLLGNWPSLLAGFRDLLTTDPEPAQRASRSGKQFPFRCDEFIAFYQHV